MIIITILISLTMTTHSLALTHDRVPDSSPLPDILLDSVQYQVTVIQIIKIFLITTVMQMVMAMIKMVLIMINVFLLTMKMFLLMTAVIRIFSQEWGLAGSEILLMLCVASAFVVVVAHTHRSVILRR